MSHEVQLPKAVREASERADAIIAELNKKQDEPANPPADDPANPPVDEPASPPADDPTPPKPPAPKVEKKEESAEHKYKVLQGKYNAEVPRLTRQLRETQNENSELRQRVTNLETLVAGLSSTTRQTPEAATVEQDLTAEEIERFGPDLIDVIQRVVKKTTGADLDAKLRPVQDNLKQVSQQLDNRQKTDAESARGKVYEALFEEVPDWQVQNDDPQFMEWLQNVDPYSGRTRMELLSEAFEANKATVVVNLFKGFQSEHAVVDPDPTPPAPSGDETPGATEPPQAMDELVAPGTPKTGTAGAQEESNKRIWTRKDIESLYAEKNEFIRKYPEKETPKRLVELEKDLLLAQTQGRIRV